MRSLRLPFILLSVALVTSGLAGRQGEVRVGMSGDVEHRLSLSNADIQKQFAGEIREVSFTLKKVDGRVQAIPLLSLVNAASPKLNAKRKHAPLAFAVVVEGEDG